MSKIVMHKHGRGLWANNDEAIKALAAIKDGRDVVVTAKAPRNIKHLALYHVLLGEIMDSGAWPSSREALEDWVKLRVGWFRTVKVGDRNHYIPKSISVESMGQAKFNDFFDRAIYFICHDLLKSDDWEGLRNQIIESVERRNAPDEHRAARAA